MSEINAPCSVKYKPLQIPQCALSTSECKSRNLKIAVSAREGPTDVRLFLFLLPFTYELFLFQ